MTRFRRSWLSKAVFLAVPAAGVVVGMIWAFAEVSPDRPRISNVWPLSVIERLSRGRAYTHAFPPFFTKSENLEETRRTLRPLGSMRVDRPDGDVAVDFLPPIGRMSKSSSERSFNFFPLITHRKWISNDGAPHQFTSFLPVYHRKVDGEQNHTAFFPFYMSGTAGSVSYPIPFKSTKPYTAVFPLYGNLYGAFGNDRLSFALWPLYTRIEKKGFVKHQVLWPIFTFGSGGGYKSVKIWPIYGRTEKIGQYVSQFAAWPIFNFTRSLGEDRRTGKDITAGLPMYWDIAEGGSHAKSLFPFYGRRTTPDLDRSFRLWPLYIHTQYKGEGYETRDYAWPIFSRTEGSVTGYKFWPLFGVKKRRDAGPVLTASSDPKAFDLSAFYLWTLGKYERSVRKDSRRVYNRLFPLYIYGRFDDAAGYSQRQFFLWPLISYQSDSLQDATAVSFLNLLGTLEAQFEPIQEVYSPLWRIVDYARQGDESRLSLLWNLVDVRREADQVALSVGPVFTFHKNAEGVQEYTLLSAFHIRNRGTVRDRETVQNSAPLRLPTLDTAALNRRLASAWAGGVDWMKGVGAQFAGFLNSKP